MVLQLHSNISSKKASRHQYGTSTDRLEADKGTHHSEFEE